MQTHEHDHTNKKLGDKAMKPIFLRFLLKIIETVDVVSINAIINYLIIYRLFCLAFVISSLKTINWSVLFIKFKRESLDCLYFINTNRLIVLTDVALLNRIQYDLKKIEVFESYLIINHCSFGCSHRRKYCAIYVVVSIFWISKWFCLSTVSNISWSVLSSLFIL